MSKTSTRSKKIISFVLATTMLLSVIFSLGVPAVAYTEEIITTSTTTETQVPFSWDNATVYYLMTDRFNNGDTTNDHAYGRGLDQDGQAVTFDESASFQGGDFKGITDKINEGYFNDLGVNAIWMSAPYEQIHGYVVAGDAPNSIPHYSYHGYYVLDYTETDKAFGTKEEFQTLVDTAHNNGIRIVLDVVMNHAGYNSMKDMSEYSFGTLKSGWESYYYLHQNVNNSSYHSYIDYDSSARDWSKWWGKDWVRAGVEGYTAGGQSDYTMNLLGLPDFKTESKESVRIPTFLEEKWKAEDVDGSYNEKMDAYGSTNTVTGYLTDWLSEWVRDYGVDGFRVDTAKHVELSSWETLNEKCTTALAEWKALNSDKALDDAEFWMTGEAFGRTLNGKGNDKDGYYTEAGFDSMINFAFAPAVGESNIPSKTDVQNVYSTYASTINTDDQFNVLSYISSHDTTLATGDRIDAGSFLLMLPGGVQIFYGDETNRKLIEPLPSGTTQSSGHQLRSFMNWNTIDADVQDHWQILGTFRNNHLSVGAGSHSLISAYDETTGYTFARKYNKDGIEDAVVVTQFAQANTNVTINVSTVFTNGQVVTNVYDNTQATVTNGTVTFNSGVNGTILVEGQAEVAETKYYVAGDEKLTGYDWLVNGAEMTETQEGIYTAVFENVPAGEHQWKVTDGTWDTTYTEEGLSPPGGGNAVITLTAQDTVTITFDFNNKVALASSPSRETITYDYFVAGSPELTTTGWVQAGAGMTKELDGTYKVTFKDIPAGTYSWKVTDGTWNNAWGEEGRLYGENNASFTTNALSDVTITFDPTAGKALATSDARVMPELSYTIAGQRGLTGIDWTPSATQNDMTEIEAGIWQITYENIAAGSYEFKVAKNHGWSEAYGDPSGPDGNAVANVTADKPNVTITFNETTKEITITYIGTEEPTDPPTEEPTQAPTDPPTEEPTHAPTDPPTEEPTIPTYTITGQGGIANGIDWDETATVNDMTETSIGHGIYEIVMQDVLKGSYEFKVVENHSWSNPSWGIKGTGENFVANIHVAETDEDGTLYDVNIKFDYHQGAIQYTVVYADETFPADNYTLVGDPLLGNNVGWDASSTATDLIPLGDENYYIVLNDVKAGEYGVKIVENHSWDNPTWGEGSANKTIKIGSPEFGDTSIYQVVLTFNYTTGDIQELNTYQTGFVLTEEMLASDWANFEQDLRIEVIDVLGSATIYDLTSPYVSVVDSNTQNMEVFGQSYDLTSKIVKIGGTKETTSTIRYYLEGTAPNEDKLSTPKISPIQTTLNGKVFYIDDYANYNRYNIENVLNMMYDEKYNVTFNYPDFEDITGQTYITRTEQVYITSNINNVAMVAESRYNNYEFVVGTGTPSDVTSDVEFTTNIVAKKLNISLDVERVIETEQTPYYTQALQTAENDIKIFAISQEGSTSIYEVNQEGYNGYVSQYDASVTYGRTIWVVAPKTSNGANFVGWYSIDENAFVSYENEFKFILTHSEKLIPVYDDNTEITVSATPYTLSSDAIVEVFDNEQNVTRVKYTFPLSYYVPQTVENNSLLVRYQVVQTGQEPNLANDSSAWGEPIDLTNLVNKEGHVNYFLTSNFYNNSGQPNDITIYVQTYIVYDGNTVYGNNIATGVYEYSII